MAHPRAWPGHLGILTLRFALSWGASHQGQDASLITFRMPRARTEDDTHEHQDLLQPAAVHSKEWGGHPLEKITSSNSSQTEVVLIPLSLGSEHMRPKGCTPPVPVTWSELRAQYVQHCSHPSHQHRTQVRQTGMGAPSPQGYGLVRKAQVPRGTRVGQKGTAILGDTGRTGRSGC